MRHNGLTFTKVTPEEKKEVEPMLRAVVDAAGPSNDGEPPVPFERISFFKVPFTQALDLVRPATPSQIPIASSLGHFSYPSPLCVQVNGRKVYLRAGFAYVPQEKLTNLIVARFRAALSYSLVCAYKTLPAVLRDERISPMLLNLSKAYVGQQFGATQVKGDEVTADQVDGVRHISDFPASPCRDTFVPRRCAVGKGIIPFVYAMVAHETQGIPPFTPCWSYAIWIVPEGECVGFCCYCRSTLIPPSDPTCVRASACHWSKRCYSGKQNLRR